MKRLFYLISLVLFIPYLSYANGMMDTNKNPNISLNPLDVPLFYDNNPLTGMKFFTLITSFHLKNIEMQKRIQQSIEKTLKEVGEIVHIKDDDMRGFGTGNLLFIQMANLIGWDGNELPIIRISLSIETSVTVEKTGMKTFPMIWSINTFLQGSLDSLTEVNLTNAILKLVGDFVQSYHYVNRDQTRKPVFYIYD